MGEHMGQKFDAVELNTVLELRDSDGETYCVAIHEQKEYEHYRDVEGNVVRVMYSVYGHNTEGHVECFADCATLDDAILIGTALAKHWSVPLNNYAFEVEE